MAGNRITVGRNRELAYLEVLSNGIKFRQGWEALRSSCKTPMGSLCHIREISKLEGMKH